MDKNDAAVKRRQADAVFPKAAADAKKSFFHDRGMTMDYAAYREAYFVEPTPKPRFSFSGLFGFPLFLDPYEEAVAFYSLVLGPPVYVEGDSTRGWRIGGSWLTLFPARQGNPKNAEISLIMESPAEAERLQKALIEAGGSAEEPFNDMMYEPLRFCPAADPFGSPFLIVARLEDNQ